MDYRSASLLNAIIKIAFNVKLLQRNDIGQRIYLPSHGSVSMNSTGFITDLIEWIDNNLEEKLDINTVAGRAGYSKWHLQRMFKRQTGYALGEYIRMQKLRVSAERLANSGEPIVSVAISLGFDSQQSFNRSFKRHYGQTPGDWRRAVMQPSMVAGRTH